MGVDKSDNLTYTYSKRGDSLHRMEVITNPFEINSSKPYVIVNCFKVKHYA